MTLALAPHLTQRVYTWTNWKLQLATRQFRPQFDEDAESYLIYGYDGPEVHLCTIYRGAVPHGVLAEYSQEQNDIDRVDFEANYKGISNQRLELRTVDGRSRFASEKSDAPKVTIYSHDWSDPTTWTTKAVRVVAELAEDSGDHRTFTVSHQDIIDTAHGKVTQEALAVDASGHSFRVSVTVNGSPVEEQDPHYGSGGDYTVDYGAGIIEFFEEIDPGAEVRVTYHYANGSDFIVAPLPGRRLLIDAVECQFSEDIVLTDTVEFQAYGLVDVFAPQLMGEPHNIPSGTKIPIGEPLHYKTMTDYQNDARGAFPVYPVMGGSGWRGATQRIIVFVWDYISGTPLSSIAGMEIRIRLLHDRPFEGYYATATFYCLSESEPV